MKVLYVLLFVVAVCSYYMKADKQLLNYNVPLNICLTKAELLGCDEKMKCEHAKLTYHSNSCLILEADAKQ